MRTAVVRGAFHVNAHSHNPHADMLDRFICESPGRLCSLPQGYSLRNTGCMFAPQEPAGHETVRVPR